MRKLTGASLLPVFILAIQGYAKGPVLSAQVLHARYVALGYETAGGFVGEFDIANFGTTKVESEDRRALENIHTAIRKWNRYVVTVDPRQADMLIAVRSGRLASVTGGVRIHTGSIDPTGRTTPTGTAIGRVYGAEAGPPNDYFSVYQADEGKEGPMIWRKTEPDGLVGTNPPLMQRFKDDVESFARKSTKP
jgi:hypothetical protein